MGTIISPKQRRVAFTTTETVSPFVRTHCPVCVYGWVRTNPKGEQLLVCLLDREQVYSNLADCTRYELQEGLEPPQEAAPEAEPEAAAPEAKAEATEPETP